MKGELRDDDTNWSTIYKEWAGGTGPERSIFEGKHEANSSIKEHYTYKEALNQFLATGKSKEGGVIDFGLTDVVSPGTDMQMQMMGSYNISFYKLGDKTLSLAQDSKSRTSFYYHLPLTNYSRSQGRPISDMDLNTNSGLAPYTTGYGKKQTQKETTTYQSYIFFDK